MKLSTIMNDILIKEKAHGDYVVRCTTSNFKFKVTLNVFFGEDKKNQSVLVLQVLK